MVHTVLKEGVTVMLRRLFVARLWLVMMTLAITPVVGHALDNGLAKTPPMGWNSWNKFGCKGLNEKVVRETADTMVSSGMKDAGYQFVILDDCWQTGRDASRSEERRVGKECRS